MAPETSIRFGLLFQYVASHTVQYIYYSALLEEKKWKGRNVNCLSFEHFPKSQVTSYFLQQKRLVEREKYYLCQEKAYVYSKSIYLLRNLLIWWGSLKTHLLNICS